MADKTPEEIAAEEAAALAQLEAEEKAAAEAAAAAAPAETPPPAPLEAVKVRAVKNDFYNPFTRQTLVLNEEVEAPLDGWLQSQLDAGFVVKV